MVAVAVMVFSSGRCLVSTGATVTTERPPRADTLRVRPRGRAHPGPGDYLGQLGLRKRVNHGFLYLKPHANTGEARAFLEEFLEERRVQIKFDGEVDTETIVARGIAERHYGSIAKRAYMDPANLVLQPSAMADFEAAFGFDWQTALDKGLVYNAPQAMEALKLTAQELDDVWSPLELGKTKIKFGGGFYCGLIAGIFVINGFYMAMRSTYTKPGRGVRWYFIRWLEEDLRWKSFRRNVLGATDPALASPTSLRALMKEKYRDLGMTSEPNLGENCVHASASPFEAFVEKCNWTDLNFEKDEFASEAERAGVPREFLEEWSDDPLVMFQGRRQSVFDILEDLDHSVCINTLKRILDEQREQHMLRPPVRSPRAPPRENRLGASKVAREQRWTPFDSPYQPTGNPEELRESMQLGRTGTHEGM